MPKLRLVAEGVYDSKRRAPHYCSTNKPKLYGIIHFAGINWSECERSAIMLSTWMPCVRTTENEGDCAELQVPSNY